MDENGDQFVAYFLPTDKTVEQRKCDALEMVPYIDDEKYAYKMTAEYNWNVKSKATKGYEESYFLVLRENGWYYDEFETRVRLSKRRPKSNVAAAVAAMTNVNLVVRHRPLKGAEHKLQVYRDRQLRPAGEYEAESDTTTISDEDSIAGNLNDLNTVSGSTNLEPEATDNLPVT